MLPTSAQALLGFNLLKDNTDLNTINLFDFDPTEQDDAANPQPMPQMPLDTAGTDDGCNPRSAWSKQQSKGFNYFKKLQEERS